MTIISAQWGKHKVNLEWVESSFPPEDIPVSSVHGFCFINGDRIILAHVESKGWVFPGGHVEEFDDTIEESFHREAQEEANIEGTITPLGYVIVDNRNDENWDPERYAPISAQMFYRMDITEIGIFTGDYETDQRVCLEYGAVPQRHSNWNEIYQLILDRSIQLDKSIDSEDKRVD